MAGKPADRTGSVAPQAVPDQAVVQAQALSFYLELLHRFAKAGPGEQAEIFANIQRDFEAGPTPATRLRYALALATPNHAASNAPRAQSVLRELLETPEQLSAPEHAAAYLELIKLDQQLGLASENRRLQVETERIERERIATLTRRLQSEADENVRLRRALEEAQAKLDAIANIERRTITPPAPRANP